MEKPLLAKAESTEGIETHHVKSRFNQQKPLTGTWLETTDVVEEIESKFSSEVFSKHNELTQTATTSKGLAEKTSPSEHHHQNKRVNDDYFGTKITWRE